MKHMYKYKKQNNKNVLDNSQENNKKPRSFPGNSVIPVEGKSKEMTTIRYSALPLQSVLVSVKTGMKNNSKYVYLGNPNDKHLHIGLDEIITLESLNDEFFLEDQPKIKFPIKGADIVTTKNPNTVFLVKNPDYNLMIFSVKKRHPRVKVSIDWLEETDKNVKYVFNYVRVVDPKTGEARGCYLVVFKDRIDFLVRQVDTINNKTIEQPYFCKP